MAERQNTKLEGKLRNQDLGELLRVGLMLAQREQKAMTTYFLSMALLDLEDQS